MGIFQGERIRLSPNVDGDGEGKKPWEQERKHFGDHCFLVFLVLFFCLFIADGAGHFWLLAACAHILGCIWAPFLSGDPGQ